jgi:hypothetical protein
MKTIRISKKATARDYARAAASASPVISNRDHIAPVVAGIGFAPKLVQGISKVVDAVKSLKKGKYEGYNLPFKLLAGIEALRSKGYTLEQILTNENLFAAANWLETKTEDYRTSTVQANARKDIDTILSNPAKYNLSTPIPSPAGSAYTYQVLSNEQNAVLYDELVQLASALENGLKQTQQVTEEIKPLEKVMTTAILEAGQVPPESTLEKLEVFNDLIVAPATGSQPASGAGADALADAAIAFIGSLMEKKKAGETLPGIYDKIATGGIKTEEKIASAARSRVEANIGAFITSNPLLVFGALLLLAALIFKKR